MTNCNQFCLYPEKASYTTEIPREDAPSLCGLLLPLLLLKPVLVSAVCTIAAVFFSVFAAAFVSCCLWAADRRTPFFPPFQCLTPQNANKKPVLVSAVCTVAAVFFCFCCCFCFLLLVGRRPSNSLLPTFAVFDPPKRQQFFSTIDWNPLDLNQL